MPSVSDWEPVDSSSDWEPVPEPSLPFSPGLIQQNPRYYQKPPGMLETAFRGIGEAASAALNIPEAMYREATGVTPRRGVVQTDASGNEVLKSEEVPLHFQAGKPAVEFPRTVLQPEGNAIQKLVEGFITPENIALFPFSAAKPVQAAFLAQTAPAAVQAASRLVSPDVPQEQKHEAATDLLINGLMSIGIAGHMAKPKAEPVRPSPEIPRPAAPEVVIPEGGEMSQWEAVQFPVQEIKPTEVSNAGSIEPTTQVGLRGEGQEVGGGTPLRQQGAAANLPPQEGAVGRGGAGQAPEAQKEVAPQIETLWSSSEPKPGKANYFSNRKEDADAYGLGRESQQHQVTISNPFDPSTSKDAELVALFDKLGGIYEAPQKAAFIKALKSKGYDSVIGGEAGFGGESKWVVTYEIPKATTQVPDLSKEASNVEKGIQVEAQDHPKVAATNPELLRTLAEDELKLDPEAYKGDEVKSVVSPPETLVQAAFRLPTGKILKVGAFHDASKLPKKYLDDPSDPMTDYAGEVEPGWVTSTGRFVGREEATTVGKQSGQVPEGYNYPAHHRVVKLPESVKPLPKNRVKTGETEGGGAGKVGGVQNPASEIIPSGFVDFDILEEPRLGLTDPPPNIETIPSGPLPEGTIYKSVGNGFNGNRPATYAFTPDGKVYDDSGRTMTHGGSSPWVLRYVTKWFNEPTKPTPPATSAGVEMKQLWELTQSEYAKARDAARARQVELHDELSAAREAGRPTKPILKELDDLAEKWFRQKAQGNDAQHFREVVAAIAEGKPVPPEVLKDYPNLRQPSTQSQGPGTTAGEKPTTPVVGEQKPPLSPVKPGGGLSTRTAEEQAKSKENNSLKAMAEANGVTFVEGDTPESLMAKINAKAETPQPSIEDTNRRLKNREAAQNDLNWREVSRKESEELTKTQEGKKITSQRIGNKTGAYGVDEIFYADGVPFLKTSIDSARQKGRVLKFVGKAEPPPSPAGAVEKGKLEPFKPTPFRISNEELVKLANEQRALRERLFKKDKTPKKIQRSEDLKRWEELQVLTRERNDWISSEIQKEVQHNMEKNSKFAESRGFRPYETVDLTGYPNVTPRGQLIPGRELGTFYVDRIEVKADEIGRLRKVAPTKPTPPPSEPPSGGAGDVAERWILKAQKQAAKTHFGKSSPDAALKVVSEWIREGETPDGPIPKDVQDALMRSLKATKDLETGETLGPGDADWPRTGTLLDFLESRSQDRMPGNISEGPGAASPGDVPLKSQIEQLGSAFKGGSTQRQTLTEKLKEIFDLTKQREISKDLLSRTLSALKTSGNYLIDIWKGQNELDPILKSKGILSAELEKRGWRMRQAMKDMKRAVPDLRVREAISKYVDAGGDIEKLRTAAETVPPTRRAPYIRAMQLTPEEKIFAGHVQSYFESRLQEAIDAGVLREGIEDYMHRIYPRETDWKRGVVNAIQNGILDTRKPGLAMKRVFDLDSEAEKAGYHPVNDFIPRILDYEASLSKVIASREAVKRFTEIKMPDGRPMLDVAGVGIPVENAEGVREATLIKPSFKPGEKQLGDDGKPTKNYRQDYQSRDYHALKKWKWAATDSDGQPIMVEGNVLIHPDAVHRIDALLRPSTVRKYAAGRAALNVGSVFKQTMLDFSGFHQVQIAVHGLEHRVNPFNLVKEINFEDPRVDGLLRGGITLGGEHVTGMAEEGLVGRSLSRQIPGLGTLMQTYHQWLFQDFIPRVKMTMALHALERNKKAFAKDLASGKMSEDALYYQTAKEANAAFGGLNYIMLERSKSIQDLARLTFLAPDFLEARGRFVGQALTRLGAEQRAALFLGAVTMYAIARVMNKALDDQYHFEPDNFFSVVYKGKAYSLRTVQGDILHALEEPVRFWLHRLNPTITRPAFELMTGRDEFGRKRDFWQVMGDTISNIIPISMRNSREQKWWVAMLNAFGGSVRRYNEVHAVAQEAQDWKRKNNIRSEPGEFIYDPSKDIYRPLKLALMDGDRSGAEVEYRKLIVSNQVTPEQIWNHFKLYANSNFTGSKANEDKFVASLTKDQHQSWLAAKQEKQRVFDEFKKLAPPPNQNNLPRVPQLPRLPATPYFPTMQPSTNSITR